MIRLLLFALVVCASSGCSQSVPDLEGVHLIKFYADWCGPCKTQKPAVDRLEKRYADEVNFLHIDVDAEQAIAQEFEVQSIPCIIIVVDGHIKKKFIGVQSYSRLAGELEKHIQ